VEEMKNKKAMWSRNTRRVQLKRLTNIVPAHKPEMLPSTHTHLISPLHASFAFTSRPPTRTLKFSTSDVSTTARSRRTSTSPG
jgi:hypothetical protein